MLTPRDADRAIGAAIVAPLATEEVGLRAAAGRVLATDACTDLDQPPFDRVAMDGIAIRTAAWQAGLREFRIAHTQGAGSPPRPLERDADCIEIMTGASLPPGADAVVPVERLHVEGAIARVDADATVLAGANVHRRGSDRVAGDRVVQAGLRLRAPEVALLAAAGVTAVTVRARPRIVVVSTGDELVEPDVVPLPWQVRRSNAYGIVGALAQRGYARVRDLHLRDDPEALASRLGEELDDSDVLVLSGGVSAGRFDHVPDALARIGVPRRFHKVAQRPGRPLWFGVGPRGQLVFGLPGNPVSTLVCLVRYVLPALGRLEGAAPVAPPVVRLSAAVARHPELTLFLPADLSSDAQGLLAVPRLTQGSGDFPSLAHTAGFVELDNGQSAGPDAAVPFYHW